MQALASPAMRYVNRDVAVQASSVQRVRAGQDADLFVGRTASGQIVFFFEDSRCRWLVGESADVTRAGWLRWGHSREDLLACVGERLADPYQHRLMQALRRMLPTTTATATTSLGGTTAQQPG